MHRRFPRAATLLAFPFIAFVLTAVASQATTEIGHPVMRVFTPRSYGADAQNRSAVRDASGVMYFADTNGVLASDGATWRVIRTGYSETIRSLALADDDTIYLGGSHQIGCLQATDTGREFVSFADQLPGGEDDFFFFWQVVAHRGAVYFSTRRAVLIWRDGRFAVLPVENPANAPLELHAAGDEVYVSVDNRPLQRIRGDRLELASDDPFFRDNTVCGFEREPDGGFLIATTRHGIFRWLDGRFAPVRTEVDALLRSQREPDRGWFGSADDVRSMCRPGDAWRDEGVIAGVPTGTRSLAETADGTLWTATMTDGAYGIRFGASTAAEPRGPAEVTHFDVGTHGLPAKHSTMCVYAWGERALFAMSGEGDWTLVRRAKRFRGSNRPRRGTACPSR